MSQGYLVLESGEVYQGRWMGGKSRAGEVVFNTSHCGFEEIATDPSYYSQIVVMTAPMQGNYSVDQTVWESRQLWIEGFVSLQLVNTQRESGWVNRLREHNVATITELDTRSLVIRLRSGGTPWGALVQANSVEDAKKQAIALISEKKKIDKDWVWSASRKKVEVREGVVANGPKIAILDFGAKENIFRELLRLSSEICIFPSRASIQQILDYKPDGIMLTNGPGDPADVQVATGTVRELVGRIPIFGICMGHQILGLALGAKTYKLKFGHRGSNHPIKDLLLNKVYVSSQNHGYAVDGSTLPKDIQITQVNLNDQTVAGFYSQERKVLGIQFHPESHPGPHEAAQLFDFFIQQIVRKP